MILAEIVDGWHVYNPPPPPDNTGAIIVCIAAIIAIVAAFGILAWYESKKLKKVNK